MLAKIPALYELKHIMIKSKGTLKNECIMNKPKESSQRFREYLRQRVLFTSMITTDFYITISIKN